MWTTLHRFILFDTGTYIKIHRVLNGACRYSTAGDISENQKTADWSERKNNEYSLIL